MLERGRPYETFVTVPTAIYRLQEIELNRKPLVAEDQLQERLTELLGGRRVPLVVFNCLEFSWRPANRAYPQSIVSADSSTAICGYYADYIEVVKMELDEVGNPELNIIVPDSELLDDRVFSFAQTLQERLEIARSAKDGLSSVLSRLDGPESRVKLWSEYCQNQGLRSPIEYTSENYQRIQADPQLQKKVKDQMKDSRRYFEKNGLFADYLKNLKEGELFDRTAWYLAMYMGEGQALRDSRAIVLNLEDSRVSAWFQRGAGGELPILNPVDPNEFYAWRRSAK